MNGGRGVSLTIRRNRRIEDFGGGGEWSDAGRLELMGPEESRKLGILHVNCEFLEV